MNDVFPSSETYDLDPRDLADLPDAEKVSVKFDASVVVLLGDERKGISDALLKGRSAVETAAAQNIPFIPVQIVFRRRTARFDVLSPFCKVFRRRFISYGTQIYHINPREIRQKRLERNIRTVENAFNWKKFHWTPEQRRKRLDDLRASVAENAWTICALPLPKTALMTGIRWQSACAVHLASKILCTKVITVCWFACRWVLRASPSNSAPLRMRRVF